MHVEKRYLDSKFPEFLKVIKYIDPLLNADLAFIKKEWSEEIGTNFSIGSFRRLMREENLPIKHMVSEILVEYATDADKAMRALLCQAYYRPLVRLILIQIICESKDDSAPNHAAYLLTRLPEIPLQPYERSLLLAFLVERNDVENAQNALRWAEDYNNFSLSAEETNTLTELTAKASR